MPKKSISAFEEKVIGEYCLFFIKKSSYILHNNYNISNEGWYLDSNRFKDYAQKVLFDNSFHSLGNGCRQGSANGDAA